MYTTNYTDGFCVKCAQYGIDPEALVKLAQDWGTDISKKIIGGLGGGENWQDYGSMGTSMIPGVGALQSGADAVGNTAAMFGKGLTAGERLGYGGKALMHTGLAALNFIPGFGLLGGVAKGVGAAAPKAGILARGLSKFAPGAVKSIQGSRIMNSAPGKLLQGRTGWQDSLARKASPVTMAGNAKKIQPSMGAKAKRLFTGAGAMQNYGYLGGNIADAVADNRVTSGENKRMRDYEAGDYGYGPRAPQQGQHGALRQPTYDTTLGQGYP